MGIAVDLIMDNGTRIHFVHKTGQPGQRGDTYLPPPSEPRYIEAVFANDMWDVTTRDGWTYFFPFRPKALPQYVTVLTSFIDPQHHRYEMERDSFGSLLDVTSPSGQWLHFANDTQHRIRKITSSTGRSIEYEYDGGGHMTRATSSDGHIDSYTYDDRGQMLTAAHENGKIILTNQYAGDGCIRSQAMDDFSVRLFPRRRYHARKRDHRSERTNSYCVQRRCLRGMAPYTAPAINLPDASLISESANEVDD